MMRRGQVDAKQFGHGYDTGEWFMHVNLARDVLSLAGQEVSDWDSWRDAPAALRVLDGETRSLCDDMAIFVTSKNINNYVKIPPWA